MSRRTSRNRRASSRGEPSAGSSANEQDEEEEDDNSGAEANAESTSEKETAAPSTRRSKRTRKPTAKSVIAAASTHVRKRKPPGEAKSKEEQNSISGDDRDSEEDPSKEPQNSKSSKQSESGDSSDESEKEVQENLTKNRTRPSQGSLRRKASSKREKDSKDGDSSDDESDDEPLTKLRASKRSAPKKQTRKGGSKSGDALEGSEEESKTADASEEGDGSDDEPLTNLKSAKRTTRKTPTKKSASNGGAANSDADEKDSNTVDDSDEDNSDDEPLTKLRAALESKRKGRSMPSEPGTDESEKVGSSDEDEADNKEPFTMSKSGGSSDESGESDKSSPIKPRVSKRSPQKRRTTKERDESLEKDDDDQERANEPDGKEPLTKSKSGGSSDQGDKSDENPPKKSRASKLPARTRQTKKGRQESIEGDDGNNDAPPKKAWDSRRTAVNRSKGSETAGGDSSDEGKESADEHEREEDAAEKPKESEEGKSAQLVSDVKKGKVDSSKEQESSGEENGIEEDEEDPPRDQRKSRRISGRRPRNKDNNSGNEPDSDDAYSKGKHAKGSETAGGDGADKGKESADAHEREEDAAEKPKESEEGKSAQLVSDVKKGKVDSSKEQESSGEENGIEEDEEDPPRDQRKSRRISGRRPRNKDNNSGNEPDSDDASSKGKHATSRSSRSQKKVEPTGGESSEGDDKSADDGRGSPRLTRRSKRRRLDQEKSSRDEATSGDNDSLPSNRAGEESEDLDTMESSVRGGGIEEAEKRISGTSPPHQEVPEKDEISPPPTDAPEENEEVTDEKITLAIVEGPQKSMQEEDSDEEKSKSGVASESRAGNNLTLTMEIDDAVTDGGNPPEKIDTAEEETDPANSKIGKDETEDATPRSREQFSDSHDRDSKAVLPSKPPVVIADTKHASEGLHEVTSIDAERPADETGVDVEFWNSSDADEVAVSEKDERPEDSSTKEDKNDLTDLKSEVQSSSNMNHDEPASRDQKVDDASEPVPENKDSETAASEVAPAVDVDSFKTRVGDSGRQAIKASIEDDPIPSRASQVPTEMNATKEPIETGREGSESEDNVVVPVDSEATGGASHSDSIVDGPGTNPLEVSQAVENQAEAKVETLSTEVEVPRDEESGPRSPDDIVDEERHADMKPKGDALKADPCKDTLHFPPKADTEEREDKAGDLANTTLTRDGSVAHGLKNLTVSSAEDVRDELTLPTPVETKEEDKGEEGGREHIAEEEKKERNLQENGTSNTVVEEHEGEKEKAPNSTYEKEALEAIDSGNKEQMDATTCYESESAAIELEKSKEQNKDISPETKEGSQAGEDVVKISDDHASNAEGFSPLFMQHDVKNIADDSKVILETSHNGDRAQREAAEKLGKRSGDTDNAVASPPSPENAALISSNVDSPKNLIERNSQGEIENEQSNIQDQEGTVMEIAKRPISQHFLSVQREASTDNDGDITPATPVREIHEEIGNHCMEVFSSPIRQEDIERSQVTSEGKRTDPKPTAPEVSVHNSTLVEDSDGDNEQFHDAQMELSSEPPSPQVPVDATKGGQSTQDFSPTALAISTLPLSVIHEESHQSDKARFLGLHQRTIAGDVMDKLSPEDPKAEKEKFLSVALRLNIGGAQDLERGTNAEILQTKIESVTEAAAVSSKDQEEEPNRKRSREEGESTAPQGHESPGLGQDAHQGPDLQWALAREEEKNVILPGLGSRAEAKELEGIVQEAEENEDAEIPLYTGEEDESTIGQAPYEGLDREKLDRIKAVLYSEGNRVHRGHGFERIFADYWDALSLRLSDRLSSHASERCRVAVKTFLKTRKLRRLHNKFLIGKYFQLT